MSKHRHKWQAGYVGAATADGYTAVERYVCDCGLIRRSCVQCGAMEKVSEAGKAWRTGYWSCDLCYEADFA